MSRLAFSNLLECPVLITYDSTLASQIPVFKALVSLNARIIYERHHYKTARKKLKAVVTPTEFAFAKNIAHKDGKINFQEFLVMMMVKMGKMDQEVPL